MGDGFRILEDLLRRTSLRHGVLASNIANVDTPNYKAMDVKFESSLDSAVVDLRTTDPKHIGGAAAGVSGEAVAEPSLSWGDKNNVELDMEVAKMTENALQYQAGVTLLNTKIRMFRNALRRQ